MRWSHRSPGRSTGGRTRTATRSSSDGDSVSTGDVIGLVEIMKNFQDVEAEVDGTLVEFLVENEDAVQAGQAVGRSSRRS